MDSTANRLDLWLAWPARIQSQSLLERYERLMTNDERMRASAFCFADDRHRFLVTRALVRTTLSRYLPTEPSAWIFTANEYGRPSIAAPGSHGHRLDFNVSHCDGLIVLAIRWSFRVGVDTENTRHRPLPLELAGARLSPLESEAIAFVPSDLRDDCFFQYWTLKEAYLKARGHGLSFPLNRFAITLPGQDAIRLSADPAFDSEPGRWYFWQLRVGDGHLIAICTELDGERIPDLAVTEVVPLERMRRMSMQPVSACGAFAVG